MWCTGALINCDRSCQAPLLSLSPLLRFSLLTLPLSPLLSHDYSNCAHSDRLLDQWCVPAEVMGHECRHLLPCFTPLFFLIFDLLFSLKGEVSFFLCLIFSFQLSVFFFLFINFLTCAESDVNPSGERPPCLWLTVTPTQKHLCLDAFLCGHASTDSCWCGSLCVWKSAGMVKAGLRTEPNYRFLYKLLHWLRFKFLHIFQHLFKASPLHPCYLVSLERFV